MAEEKRMAARYANDIEIAHAQRDFQLKKAAYDMEVQAKQAQSNLAADLQVCSIVKIISQNGGYMNISLHAIFGNQSLCRSLCSIVVMLLAL